MTAALETVRSALPKLIGLSLVAYVLVYLLGWYVPVPLGLIALLLAATFLYLRQGAIRRDTIEAALRAAPPDWLDAVHVEIAAIGSAPTESYFLTGQDWSERHDPIRIALPGDAKVAWLRGQTLQLEFTDQPVPSRLKSLALEPADGPGDFRLLPIPRETVDGETREIDDPAVWLSKSPKLRQLAERISTKHPEQALHAALRISGRVNAPLYATEEKPRSCPSCQQPMLPVLQIEVGFTIPERCYFLEACNCTSGAFAVDGAYRAALPANDQP